MKRGYTARPFLEEASISLRRHQERYNLDPVRLDTVEERLDLIKRLERKYGEGVEGILRFREEAIVELKNLTSSNERLSDLEEKCRRIEEELLKKAGELLSRNMGSAPRFTYMFPTIYPG